MSVTLKKWISFFIALALVIGLMPGGVAASGWQEIGMDSVEPFEPTPPAPPVVNDPVEGEVFCGIGHYAVGEAPYQNYWGDTEYAAWMGVYALEKSQAQKDALIREFEAHYGFTPTAAVECTDLGMYRVEGYEGLRHVYHYTITDTTYILILNEMYEVYHQICDNGDIWTGFCVYGNFYDEDALSDPRIPALQEESTELFLELTGLTREQAYSYMDEYDISLSSVAVAGTVRTLHDNGPVDVFYVFCRGPHSSVILGESGVSFTDVPTSSFYADAVLWAVDNGITNGLTETEFGPTTVCNRAQVVTFLWRAEGCPEPENTTHNFVDVQAGSFYEKAVLWAVENGITTGTDATHFSPDGVCNRAQVVTFLYRAFGSPNITADSMAFTDVPSGAWYEAPVVWAMELGITNGIDATHFGPDAACNRAAVVTFLHRVYTA